MTGSLGLTGVLGSAALMRRWVITADRIAASHRSRGGPAMTLAQARKRYPLVPVEILRWALENIPDPRDLDRGLSRLEQSKRIELKYAS